MFHAKSSNHKLESNIIRILIRNQGKKGRFKRYRNKWITKKNDFLKSVINAYRIFKFVSLRCCSFCDIWPAYARIVQILSSNLLLVSFFNIIQFRFYDMSVYKFKWIESHTHYSIYRIDKKFIFFVVIKWREQNTENKTGSSRFEYTPVVRCFLFYFIMSWLNDFSIESDVDVFIYGCIPLSDIVISLLDLDYCHIRNIQLIGEAKKTNKIC